MSRLEGEGTFKATREFGMATWFSPSCLFWVFWVSRNFKARGHEIPKVIFLFEIGKGNPWVPMFLGCDPLIFS
jgi:hypothetical protein